MKVTKESTKSNTFCGPAALSAITGKSVDECVKVLLGLGVRDKWPVVRGVRTVEMEKALEVMGWQTLEFEKLKPRYSEAGYPTFKQWLRHTWGLRSKDDVFLIVTSDHFLVLRGRKVWDNHSPEGRPVGESMVRCRVSHAIQCIPMKHKLLGKPVRFWDNGWRHGRLIEVLNGWAHVEAPNGAVHQVDSGDVREEI